MRLVVKVAQTLIEGIRPLLGPPGTCKFMLSCSEYAIIQLREKSIIPALWAITKRLLACNPFR
ncbi:membrane protein insertion efficiency factor YidD [bacterium]|jgi:putative component of membrane protein insertase Oxa1/YidC/SpoIIIJ protein YidD|nr:membrane protein insertion efficiency factor YidD [bacterium]MBT3903255.1 membrane protein insertion efficiency factor YidD [bacterium]MBT4578263.1 membrane protein insertion efficiency factor YidD [bacterium]MBT5345579.1 membrane protein insertion efficiency factor YidD [bacterium]MBT6131062.1 membrane protein insertion efficiency factor YidD [bacterium]